VVRKKGHKTVVVWWWWCGLAPVEPGYCILQRTQYLLWLVHVSKIPATIATDDTDKVRQWTQQQQQHALYANIIINVLHQLLKTGSVMQKNIYFITTNITPSVL